MRLEQGLVQDAVFSIIVSLCLTFAIVLISTRDVLLSLMTLMAISCVVIAVLASMVWLTWKISIIESICLTVLVGLSVDYAVRGSTHP